jgi:hypothetical protein
MISTIRKIKIHELLSIEDFSEIMLNMFINYVVNIIIIPDRYNVWNMPYMPELFGMDHTFYYLYVPIEMEPNIQSHYPKQQQQQQQQDIKENKKIKKMSTASLHDDHYMEEIPFTKSVNKSLRSITDVSDYESSINYRTIPFNIGETDENIEDSDFHPNIKKTMRK